MFSLHKATTTSLCLPRPCILSAGQPYPRQRTLDIVCSAQSVSGSLRQQQSGNRKDRLHVIALISEAVSVNVSSGNPSQLNQPLPLTLCKLLLEVWGSGDIYTRDGWYKGRILQGSCHSCHHLLCGADYDMCFLQAAVQRFETLAGRSAMVRAKSFIDPVCLSTEVPECQSLVLCYHTYHLLRALKTCPSSAAP